MRGSIPIFYLALFLVLLASCDRGGDSGLVSPSPDGMIRKIPSLPSTGLKVACPDDDNDTFARAPNCGPRDCNDLYDFYRPPGEYCAAVDSFVLEPWDRWQVGDFSLTYVDDVLHVYYIRGIDWMNNPDEHGKSFGHERTDDLLDWDFVGEILTTATGSDWDDDHIWAPSIVQHPVEQRHYMFYSGVTNVAPDISQHVERIGMAWSDDMDEWTRLDGNNCAGTIGPGCVWDCDLPWTTWGGGGAWDNHCRDPHVFRDEEHSAWYMVYSTARASDGKMVIGLARSAFLLDWADYGPIDVTAGGKAESAHTLYYNGTWYLFWTYRDDGGIKYAWTDDLEAGPWQGPLIVPGSFGSRHLASEIIPVNGMLLYAWVRDISYDIRFKTIRIEADHSVHLDPVPELGCWYIGAQNVHPGAIDIVNGIDDNCNGLIDEGPGWCANDADGDFYGAPADSFCLSFRVDCDDGNPMVNPGAEEICGNGVDDDCDGIVDNPRLCNDRFTPSLHEYLPPDR